jgi:catechol 2,3-dioxygenase-like lactoylglutathione lyase family enzyme
VRVALDHSGLSVGDLDRCVAFYGRPEPGVRFAFLADPEGNLVELVERA